MRYVEKALRIDNVFPKYIYVTDNFSVHIMLHRNNQCTW